MKNLEVQNKRQMELRQALFNALQHGNEDEQQSAFTNLFEDIQNSVMERANAEIAKFGTNYSDEQILTNRGTRKPLTSEEKKFLNAVIERKGFEGVEVAFPKTMVEDVFKNIREEHPILSRVDVRDTTGLAQYIYADPTKTTAYWGPICEDIKQMILDGFKSVDLESSRLSGFVAICKGMLELGPVWLATYLTEVIYEIMNTSLELGVVAGNGKNQPIGMIKKLSGAVDSVYPDKEKVTLSNFEPKSLAGIRAAMAKEKTDRGEVVILVNPMTYWLKVFPALAFRNDAGTWVLDVLPTGEEIIRSHAVPEDTLIFGVLDNYFLGVAGDIRIDRYTETLAIEDMDLYIAKFYGYGIPKNKNAFFVADISTVAGGTLAPIETETPAGE